MNKILNFCPYCEDEREVERITKTETFKIRNEAIQVKTKLLKCKKCHEEFEDPESKEDCLKMAYEIYREKFKWMKPEEIRKLRKEYDLTQKELASLLGFGEVTLSRYENGALQDETHDQVLKLAQNPENLIRLMETNSSIAEKRKRELLCIWKNKFSSGSWQKILNSHLGNFPPDYTNGNRSHDFSRMENAILFLCSGKGMLKTILNKALFYSDFLNFKKYNLSITGSRYVKLQFGPVPDDYEFIYAVAIHDGILKVKEIDFSGSCIGEVYTSAKNPDISMFSPEELEVMATVKKKITAMSATKASELSHQEEAYLKTAEKEYISYEFSKVLKFMK
ncbi:MAG: DUF4065 domain-containing protein [Candidatus Wallbacteria bacterium]|nr:DUF4065 domain-containing protein [Candidatus Wallbacteria bacterium]